MMDIINKLNNSSEVRYASNSTLQPIADYPAVILEETKRLVLKHMAGVTLGRSVCDLYLITKYDPEQGGAMKEAKINELTYIFNLHLAELEFDEECDGFEVSQMVIDREKVLVLYGKVKI